MLKLHTDVKADKTIFESQPNEMLTWYASDNMDAFVDEDNYLDMSVCDSAIAKLTFDQYEEYKSVFENLDISSPEIDEYSLGSMIMFFLAEGDCLVLCSHGCFDDAVYSLEEYCIERDIPSQCLIDNPDVSSKAYDDEDDPIDWADDEEILENVYTGGGSDFPHLIRILHDLQDGKV